MDEKEKIKFSENKFKMLEAFEELNNKIKLNASLKLESSKSKMIKTQKNFKSI